MLEHTSQQHEQPRCPDCGETDTLRFDATAAWSREAGGFELVAVHDATRCLDCDAEVHPDWIPADPARYYVITGRAEGDDEDSIYVSSEPEGFRSARKNFEAMFGDVGGEIYMTHSVSSNRPVS